MLTPTTPEKLERSGNFFRVFVLVMGMVIKHWKLLFNDDAYKLIWCDSLLLWTTQTSERAFQVARFIINLRLQLGTTQAGTFR